MKTHIRIAVTSLVLVMFCKGGESPPPAPSQAKPSWSLVYLPSLDWTEAESRQAVELLRQVKPDVVVSMAACPFAEALRSLENKPVVLDGTQRGKAGTPCGIHDAPLSAYTDTSTLHSFGGPGGAGPGLVWLSAKQVKKPFNGPEVDEGELRSLARMQIRKQLAERTGDLVLLEDPSVPTPPEREWLLPEQDVKYEQAACAVTSLVCIRPGTLQTQLAGGISPRTPLVHWIHSGNEGIVWEALPIDSGPAVQRSVSSYSTPRGGKSMAAWLKAPVAPSEVPRWMDDYINNNQALGCG